MIYDVLNSLVTEDNVLSTWFPVRVRSNRSKISSSAAFMLIEPFIKPVISFNVSTLWQWIVASRSFKDLANSGKLRGWLVSDWPISRLNLENLRICDANPQLLYVLRLDQ